jgi:peptide/nickel transport system substrate-binding protein/oligopeptide transport system substrate-binding protein
LGSLAFERNERFWGKKPLLRSIQYTLYKDVAVEWDDFMQGKGDVANFPAAQLTAARALKGATVFDTPALSLSYLAPNWTVAPFDDARVRQAFSLALDRNALGSESLRAFQHPTIHFVPEGIPGYNPDLTDAAGRRGKDALTPDLDVARRLASAYAAEKCAGDFAKCPPVTYTIPGGSSTQMDLAQAVVNQWRQAFPGWVILVGGYDNRQLKTRPEYQLVWDGWGADYPDPQDFLSLLWTIKALYNPRHVSVPQADALLAQADGMSDQSARIPLYQLAEQLLVNQAAAIPLYQALQNYAVRSHVVGWRIAPTLQTPLSVWQTAYIKR